MGTLELQPLCPPWVLFIGVAAAVLALAWKGARAFTWPRILHVLLLGAIGIIALGPGTQTGRTRIPRTEVLLDVSGSMTPGERFAAAAECAIQLAGESAAMDAQVAAFAGTEMRVDPPRIAALVPDGEDTRIGDALAGALARADDTLAIVVISDGANLGGEDPLGVAREAARRRIPIHVLPIGSREDAPDGIISLTAGSHLVGDRGARIPIPVRVAVTGPAPAAVAIEVQRDETPPTMAEIPLSNGVGAATIPCELPDAPFAVWTVRLRPLPGEKTLENNTAVIAAAMRVPETTLLLVEGSPTWEGTCMQRGAARDPRIHLRAARQLAPGRPVLYNLTPEEIPLEDGILHAASVHILGKGWPQLCHDAGIAERPTATILLAGGEHPNIVTWGNAARGTVSLTDAGARLAALRILAGRNAAGCEVHAPGATSLCILTTADGARITVCALLPDQRLLVFGLVNVLRVDESRFFPALIADAFPAAFAPRLRAEHANYAAGAAAVIHGPPGAAVSVTGPDDLAASLTLDPEGRAAYRPPRPGLYRLASADGMQAAFAVQVSTPELLVRRPNPELLSAIAQISGGTVVAPHAQAVADLRARLEREAHGRTELVVASVWDGVSVFLALAALAMLLWWCARGEHATR